LLKFNLRATLLVGTAVRLVLMPFTAHPFDVYAWYMYCMDVLRHGFDFSVLKSANPLWFLMLTLIAFVYRFLSSVVGWEATAVDALPASFNPHYGIAWVPGPLFNMLVKVPMLLADIGTALILYHLMKRFSRTGLAEKVVALFYLNPISIWISSGWGQSDPIPAFLTVLSVYLLLSERILPSAVSLLLATLFKVYPAAFIVPASVYLFKGKRKELLKYLIFFIVPYSIFLVSGGLQAANNLLMLVLGFFFPRGTFHGIFGFGLTYWSWSMVFSMDPNVWAPVSTLLMTVLFCISIYFVLKAKFDDPLRSLTMATYMVAVAFFLSSRLVNEARFVWLLPFFVLMVGEVVSLKLFGLVSLTAFLYTQKNFPYYLLPVATLNKDILSPLFHMAAPFGNVVQGALLPASSGAVILAALGTLFSILLFTIYLKEVRTVAFGESSSRVSTCEPDKLVRRI
jgi:Gpi18-like mannosyltransferase